MVKVCVHLCVLTPFLILYDLDSREEAKILSTYKNTPVEKKNFLFTFPNECP